MIECGNIDGWLTTSVRYENGFEQNAIVLSDNGSQTQLQGGEMAFLQPEQTASGSTLTTIKTLIAKGTETVEVSLSLFSNEQYR